MNFYINIYSIIHFFAMLHVIYINTSIKQIVTSREIGKWLESWNDISDQLDTTDVVSQRMHIIYPLSENNFIHATEVHVSVSIVKLRISTFFVSLITLKLTIFIFYW